jgi:hypothetical protein
MTGAWVESPGLYNFLQRMFTAIFNVMRLVSGDTPSVVAQARHALGNCCTK